MGCTHSVVSTRDVCAIHFCSRLRSPARPVCPRPRCPRGCPGCPGGPGGPGGGSPGSPARSSRLPRLPEASQGFLRLPPFTSQFYYSWLDSDAASVAPCLRRVLPRALSTPSACLSQGSAGVRRGRWDWLLSRLGRVRSASGGFPRRWMARSLYPAVPFPGTCHFCALLTLLTRTDPFLAGSLPLGLFPAPIGSAGLPAAPGDSSRPRMPGSLYPAVPFGGNCHFCPDPTTSDRFRPLAPGMASSRRAPGHPSGPPRTRPNPPIDPV